MNKKFALLLVSFSAIAPVLAFADASYETSGVASAGSILVTIVTWLEYIVPALVTLAVIYFVFGVISFMRAADEEQKKKSKSKIVNGLIGLFVIVAFWGIIAVVKNTFNIGNATGQNITPCIPSEENDYGEDC